MISLLRRVGTLGLIASLVASAVAFSLVDDELLDSPLEVGVEETPLIGNDDTEGVDDHVDLLEEVSETDELPAVEAPVISEEPPLGTEIEGLRGIQNASIPPTFVWAEQPNMRISGMNRFETAAAISKHTYPDGAGVVLIVTGRNFPDALSSAALGAKLGAPILLSEGNFLPPSTEAELRRLNPNRILVIGGEGVIFPIVERQLQSFASQIERIGGLNRYETSAAVVRAGWHSADQVFIATGADFPDALAAASASAEVDAPVILVPGHSATLPTDTRALLNDLNVTKLHIAGGFGAVSETMQTLLTDGKRSVQRYSGVNRYETAAIMATEIFTTPYRDVYWANGHAFSDALAGAAAAGANSAPLLLVGQHCVSAVTYDATDALTTGRVYLLGGPGVISDDVLHGNECLPRPLGISEANWDGTQDVYSRLNAARYEVGLSGYRITGSESSSPAYQWAVSISQARVELKPNFSSEEPWAVYQTAAQTRTSVAARPERIASLLLSNADARSWLLRPNAGVRGSLSVGFVTTSGAGFGVVFVGNQVR